jgi:ferritin-like metal-binding protein YciE
MALESLEGLLTRALADLHGAERLSQKTLPNMVKAAATPALKQAFERHLGETEAHVVRLTRCFALLGIPARDTTCRGMEGLVAEAGEMMDEEGPDPVVDAGLIAVAQRMEHYEIAAYGSAIGIATRLGKDEIVGLLRQTQEEEVATDRMLSELATREINDTALAAGTRISES